MRESPALVLMDLLIAKNVKIDYLDPYISAITKRDNLKSVMLTEKSLSTYDAVVLVTDHDIFDYDLIAKHSKLIVDTRGRFLNNHNIVKA